MRIHNTEAADAGRTDEFGHKEFIVETTGGPKKYYRYRRRKNPLFSEPKLVSEPKITFDWYIDLVHSLKRLRYASKLTQKQLAKLIDSNQAVISRFERGLINPSLAFLINYTEKLGWKVKLSLEEPAKNDILTSDEHKTE